MQKSPSVKANISASQEIPHILQNTNIHRCVSKQPATCPYPETTKCKTIITQTTYVYKTFSHLCARMCITLLQYLQSSQMYITTVVIYICDDTTECVNKKPPHTYSVNTTACLSNRSDKMNKKFD